MKKIISLFQRNYDGDRLVRNEVTPGSEWVIAGEGIATQKHDGTCCMVRGGKLFKRYEVKPGNKPPDNFESANEVDEITGKQQGWVPVGDGKEDQWHMEAWERGIRPAVDGGFGGSLPDWTYELLGPKIQGNPEDIPCHVLMKHGQVYLPWWPRDFDGIKKAFSDTPNGLDIEGVVWWRNINDANCDKVKIKIKDFGLKRKIRS